MANKIFDVKITEGTDLGPYNIYYDNGSGNTLGYSGITYVDLVTGDGFRISIPDNSISITLYNTRIDIIDACPTNQVIYLIATPTPTITPTLTVTVTPTLTPTLTVTPTVTLTPTATAVPLKYPHNFGVGFNASTSVLCNSSPTLTTYYSYDQTLSVNSIIYETQTMATPVNGQNLWAKNLDSSLLWRINTAGTLLENYTCPTPTPTPTMTPGPPPTPTPTVTPTDPIISWNCDGNGGCYGVSGTGGTYATYALCAANCTPTTPTPTPTPAPPPPNIYSYTFTDTFSAYKEDFCTYTPPNTSTYYSYSNALANGVELYTSSAMTTKVNGYGYWNKYLSSGVVWQINTAGVILDSYDCPFVPTPTPTPTGTPVVTIYTHYFTGAYNTSAEACFQTFSSIGLRSYDAILGVGSVIYQTTLMNDPLNGNDKWRLESAVGKAYQINTSGVITLVYDCAAQPTPTPTVTPTITVTPTVTPISDSNVCYEYTLGTSASSAQYYSFIDCDGIPGDGYIGGVGGYDATTVCAQAGQISASGDIQVSTVGPCSVESNATPTPTPTPDIPITYNCDGTNCYAVYDGTGTYAYLSDCQLNCGGGGGSGCFISGTTITMSDGTTKLIEELIVGDSLMSYDIEGLPLYSDDESVLTIWESTNISGIQSQAEIVSITPLEVNEIVVINDLMKTTINHRHLIERNGIWSFKRADEVLIGDKMLDINNNEITVVTIDIQTVESTVYKLNIETLDVFYANGILTHNDKPEEIMPQ